jgi:RNA polymerase sigma factor (sigma-70 family)
MCGENQMWSDYFEGRGLRQRNALVEHYLPVAERVVQKMLRVCPRHADADAMYGDGQVGLIRAVETYDPTRGNAPESHVYLHVRREVVQGFRNMDPVTRHAHRRAAAAGVEPARTISISDVFGPHGAPLSDFRPDPSCPDPAREVGDRDAFEAILSPLPDVERAMLALIYRDGLSQAAAARAVGITQTMASDRVRRALKIVAANLTTPQRKPLESPCVPVHFAGRPVASDAGEYFATAYKASRAVGKSNGAVASGIASNRKIAGRKWKWVTPEEFDAATSGGQECAA